MVLIPDVPSLILNLPIIISLIAITRYMIGFKTWKNYPVVVLTLAFYLLHLTTESLLATALLWVFFLISVIGSAFGTRYLLRHLKINYYARIATMYLAAMTFTLFLISILALSTMKEWVLDHNFALAVFLMGTTIDELATLHFKKGSQELLRRVITTLGLSVIMGLLLTWTWWNQLLVTHHEILLFVLVIDLIVAFWTVARLTEIARFGSILKD